MHRFRMAVRRLREESWWPLWAILGIGLLLRIAVTVFYGPSVFNYYGGDSTRYMRLSVAQVNGLFGDVAMPAGYPAFLASLRHVDAWLPFTTMVQHLLGLVGAVFLYAAVRAVGAPRWAGLFPVGIVVLSGDVLFIEHGILTEALWMPVLASAMYLIARAITAEEPRWWLAAAGVALACSAMIRSVSDLLPIVLAVWVAIALPGPLTRRLVNGVTLLLPAIAILVTYVLIATTVSNGYSGLTENSGFSLYARVAQFADCHKFDPPAGTRSLCVDIPSAQRQGPFYWAWDPESPLRSKFQLEIQNSDQQEQLSSFAKAAILHQPVEYALTVGRDLGRYFVPQAGTPRPSSGTDEEQMSFDSPSQSAQAVTPSALAAQYEEAYDGVGDGVPSSSASDFFGAYQAFFRIDGRLMLLLIALGLFGCIRGPRPQRAAASLFLLSGVVLLVIPPAVSSFDIRYSIPPINLFAVCAALGLVALRSELGARANSEGSNRTRFL